MSDLLTKDEYIAIAKTLVLPQNAFIGGTFRPSHSGKTFPTINPATGEEIGQVAACDAVDVDLAVSKAREAFDQGTWSTISPADRKQVLIRFAKYIRKYRRELAVLESLDSGKPIADCELIDIPVAADTLIWQAEALDKVYGHTAPASEDAVAMIVREPVGVVGCVLPWNFPLMMFMGKVAPALAAGCSVVVKPAEQTPLTALAAAELGKRAGLPDGVLNVVTGFGPDVGEPLGRHPGVDMLSFTGSTEVGRLFLKYAAESNLKKVALECGGKNPCIVLDDAEDLDAVAEHILTGALWHAGQNCSAISRLIVHKKIRKELLDRIILRAKEWKMGDPFDPTIRLGPLVDSTHLEKVSGYLQTAKKEDLKLLLGGKVRDGRYIEPTIYDADGKESSLLVDEVFGPVITVVTVDSLSEAIQVANDTEYGLAASVFCSNGKRAIRAARAIKAGVVTINCYGEGSFATSFGGYKQSGFGARDTAFHSYKQYTEVKTIWMDLADHTGASIDG